MKIHSQKTAWTSAKDKNRCAHIKGKTSIAIAAAASLLIVVAVGIGLGIYSTLRETGDYV